MMSFLQRSRHESHDLKVYIINFSCFQLRNFQTCFPNENFVLLRVLYIDSASFEALKLIAGGTVGWYLVSSPFPGG